MSDWFNDQANFLKKHIKEDKEYIAFMEDLVSSCPDYLEEPLRFAYMFEAILDNKRMYVEKFTKELEELNEYIKERCFNEK